MLISQCCGVKIEFHDKCFYPDWEGGIEVGEHKYHDKNGFCNVCGTKGFCSKCGKHIKYKEKRHDNNS